MSAHRRKHMSETLSAEEHTTLMAKRGEVNWLATQSMIQLEGTVGRERCPCCPISWHSRRCPRVARSSGSAETQAVTQAQEETEFIRLLWLEIVQGGHDGTIIDQEISKVGGCPIIDAKGVFDAIHRSESAALSMQDKRSAVEGPV